MHGISVPSDLSPKDYLIIKLLQFINIKFWLNNYNWLIF